MSKNLIVDKNFTTAFDPTIGIFGRKTGAWVHRFLSWGPVMTDLRDAGQNLKKEPLQQPLEQHHTKSERCFADNSSPIDQVLK